MSVPIKAGFIGAGGRARYAHYPAVARLEDVKIEAISELDPERLRAAADHYNVASRYSDYQHMLDEADIDVVYVIMAPHLLLPIVLDCLRAGKHVLVEKPPAMSVQELEAMVAAAEQHRCLTAVGFQRRYAAVVQEVRRLTLDRGPVTLCVAEFHKPMLDAKTPTYGSELLADIIHVVDFVRYMCGGEAVEVHATQDCFFTDWKNSYNALIRFSSGAVGIVSGNRASGGRILRAEVHGRGIGAYMDLVERAEVFVDGGAEPLVLTGRQGASNRDSLEYDGTLRLHRHFIDCVAEGRQPMTSFQDALGTMRLVAQIEGP